MIPPRAAGKGIAAVDAGGLPRLDSAAIRRVRGPKEPVDPRRPVAVWDEEEIAGPDRVEPCRVVLLAGAECPYTCAMCDLWKHTLDGPTPPGAIPAQLAAALDLPADPRIGAPRWIKLYNSGNFTDPRAVPVGDLPRIAAQVGGFRRVIVETHPRLVGDSLATFAASIGGRLEVAMGLETILPRFLPWLNKQMTPDDFATACRFLASAGIDARAFVLLGMPGADEGESIDSAVGSARFAAEAGCRHVSLVPTRPGNGLLDRLVASGDFTPLTAAAAEAALDGVLDALRPGCTVTLDLWDWDRLAGHCGECRAPRRARIEAIQRRGRSLPPCPVACRCRHGR